MLTILKGALILIAFLAIMCVIIGTIAVAAEEDRQSEFTDEDIAQMRFDYAHYEEDDIES